MDRKAIGRKALGDLRRDAEAASAVQRHELLSILSGNKETEYGRRYGFSGIESVEAFQSMVPMTTYEDYQGYIDRMIAGERGVLTASDPVYYAITSGSTDTPKYVPVTERDMRVHLDFIHSGIMGMVDEYFASSYPGSCAGCVPLRYTNGWTGMARSMPLRSACPRMSSFPMSLRILPM